MQSSSFSEITLGDGLDEERGAREGFKKLGRIEHQNFTLTT
jgi:hypothetical protein